VGGRDDRLDLRGSFEKVLDSPEQAPVPASGALLSCRVGALKQTH
jgi:hypothetical protein